LALRERPPAFAAKYALMETGEQREYVRDLYDLFREWLPPGFFSAAPATGIRGELLTAKVHPDELWFMRFPLTVFSQLRYEGFETYESVEWIVTRKGFISHARERELIREEVTDAARLLSGTVAQMAPVVSASTDQCIAN